MSAGFRREKIVSAIGPATWEPEVFHQMVEVEMDAVRLNLFHTSNDRAAIRGHCGSPLLRRWGNKHDAHRGILMCYLAR